MEKKKEMENTAYKRVEEKESIHVSVVHFDRYLHCKHAKLQMIWEMHSNNLHRKEASWRAKYAFMVTQWIIVVHKMEKTHKNVLYCPWCVSVFVCLLETRVEKHRLFGWNVSSLRNGCHHSLLGKHSRLCFYTFSCGHFCQNTFTSFFLFVCWK